MGVAGPRSDDGLYLVMFVFRASQPGYRVLEAVYARDPFRRLSLGEVYFVRGVAVDVRVEGEAELLRRLAALARVGRWYSSPWGRCPLLYELEGVEELGGGIEERVSAVSEEHAEVVDVRLAAGMLNAHRSGELSRLREAVSRAAGWVRLVAMRG